MTCPEPAPERADKWISRTPTATVAGLAGIAGAISYSHMRQLAAAHGDTGWHAHAFPLCVDGVEIVASLVLLADRRRGPTVRLAALGRACDRHGRQPGREHRHGRPRHRQPGDRRTARPSPC